MISALVFKSLLLQQERPAGKGNRPWQLPLPLMARATVYWLTFNHWVEGLSETEATQCWREGREFQKFPSTASSCSPHLLLCSSLLPSPSPPVNKAIEKIRTHGKSSRPHEQRCSRPSILLFFRKTTPFFRPHGCSRDNLTIQLWAHVSQVNVVCDSDWTIQNRSLCFCCDFYDPRTPQFIATIQRA